MAWAKPTTITSWSFSRYSTYRQCPFKAKCLYIDKLKEPGSTAMERGNAIHKLAETYVRGETTPKVPDELLKFSALLKEMRKLKKKTLDTVTVEETWAFKKDWSLTTWDDWNGCWLRVKVDLSCIEQDGTLNITDWKTGKFSPQFNLDDYLEQMELYAVAGLIIFADVGPDLKVIPRLRYTDHGIEYPPIGEEKIYTPGDLSALKKSWVKRTKAMLADKTFAPKPNRFCSSCHFRKANGGPCKF